MSLSPGAPEVSTWFQNSERKGAIQVSLNMATEKHPYSDLRITSAIHWEAQCARIKIKFWYDEDVDASALQSRTMVVWVDASKIQGPTLIILQLLFPKYSQFAVAIMSTLSSCWFLKCFFDRLSRKSVLAEHSTVNQAFIFYQYDRYIVT